MIIRLDELDEGLHTLEWTGQIDRVDLLYPDIVTDVEVVAHVHRLRNVVTIHAQLAGHLERPCDRTLEPVPVELDTVMDIVVHQRPGAATPRTEMEDDDYIVNVPAEQKELDLTGPIRESLVVQMPMFVYKDGTQPVTVVDQRLEEEKQDDDDDDIDPRWAGLKSVQF